MYIWIEPEITKLLWKISLGSAAYGNLGDGFKSGMPNSQFCQNILGKILKDRVTNEEIRKWTSVEDIQQIAKQKWTRHIARIKYKK